MRAFVRHMLLFALIAAVALAAIRRGAAAQPVPDDRFWDDQFGRPGVVVSTGQRGQVYAIAVGAGGDLYVGGDFTSAGGVAARNIARWDGRVWHALGAGIDGPVYALATRGNDVYAGGSFLTAGTARAVNLARWDGGAWATVGDGVIGPAPSEVRALAFFNGALIVAGSFTRAGTLAVKHVARWDGGAWDSMGGGVAGEQRAVVSDLQILDNQLYAGGQFATAGGAAARNFASWNGAAWSAPGDIGLQSGQLIQLTAGNGGIYATGTFTSAGGLAARGVARWLGGAWSPMGEGLTMAEAIIVREGRVIASVGGDLNTPAQPLRVWNGTAWEPYGILVDIPAVHVLAQTSADLYVGGWFESTQINGQVTLFNSLMRLRDNRWEPLGNGHFHNCASHECALAGNDRDLFSGFRPGVVERWDGVRRSGISPLYGASDPPVLATSGADLYMGGGFSFVAGSPNIARWDGVAWRGLGGGVNGAVKAIAADGQRVYAAGSFTQAGGAPANGLAVWDGGAWAALGSGVLRNGGPGQIRALAAGGGRLTVAGAFTSVNGVPAANITQWDGTTWRALGAGAPAEIGSLALSGPLIYGVAGASRFGDTIMRWDGSSWATIGVAAGQVTAIAMHGDQLIITGKFTSVSGVAASSVARWDGAAWRPLGGGLAGGNAMGHSLAVVGHNIYIWGDFTSAGGRPSFNLAHWNDVRTPLFIPALLK